MGSAARLPGRTDQLDVSDGAFAHFDGPVQAVDANEVVVGRHKPLHLDIRALADAEPDEWLRELGRRKIDSLVVDDDDVFRNAVFDLTKKVICLCRVFSLKCPICGSFWHFRKMISVICGSLPRKISSRGY